VAATILAALLSGCGGSHRRPTEPPPPARAPAVGALSASGAGHRFYEIYEPSGPVRGTMLLLHGGGWTDARGDARRDMATAALALEAEGWRVVNVSYTAGQKPPGAALDPLPMLRDVVAFYDQIHRAFGGPICAYGQSAGGHLAAMLAVERPSLRCAILDAAPVDLPTVLRETDPAGVYLIRHTFGTRQSTLASWSPARELRRASNRPAMLATYAAGDLVVPPQQGDVLRAVDPAANVAVVPRGPFYWLHSTVDQTALFGRLTAIFKWLDHVVPRSGASSSGRGTDAGSGCDSQPAEPDRFRLMLAGDAWQQVSSPGQQLITATRGCSGSGRWQDDGLSLWALPSTTGTPVHSGAFAALLLDSGHALRQLSVTFRGFLVNPRDWVLGLYSTTSDQATPANPVAVCDRGRCNGLGLVSSKLGALVTATGSSSNPDLSDQPPSARFTLPTGTRRIAWVLRCVAPGGCSTKGVTNASGVSARPRDPLGQAAIFSIYRADVK
jgi:acetyl esterase/lipase